MNSLKHLQILSLVLLFCSSVLCAQVKVSDAVAVDRTSFDFGLLHIDEKPESRQTSCEFTITNISDRDIVIEKCISACTCMRMMWTKGAIKPGKTGMIGVDYTHEGGSSNVNKAFSVYISGEAKPVILHITGSTQMTLIPVSTAFPVQRGNLGFKNLTLDAGTIKQGDRWEKYFETGNYASEATQFSFKALTDDIVLDPETGIIQSDGTRRISYIILTDRKVWGTNTAKALILEGQEVRDTLNVNYFVIDDCAGAPENPNEGPYPYFSEDRKSLGTIKKGQVKKIEVPLKNIGYQALLIHKAESDSPAVSIAVPEEEIESKETVTLTITVDGALLPAGEFQSQVNVITNSKPVPVAGLRIYGTVSD